MKTSTPKRQKASGTAATENAPSDHAAGSRRSDRTKRENFKLPERTAADLERISRESGITKTEVVRQGIALMRVSWDESKLGNRLVVISPDGVMMKELILA